MASSDEYSRDLERVIKDTEDRAEWARDKSAQDAVKDFEQRRKAIGWKYSEFYDAFIKDPRGTINELERREQRTTAKSSKH